MFMCLKHRGLLLLWINVKGRRQLPEAFAHASMVTLSFDCLKFFGFLSSTETSDLEGNIRHHKPVSSALKI